MGMSNSAALDMMGKPYDKNGQGPNSFNCWGAVRFYFEHALDIEMPMVAVGKEHDGSTENVGAIKRAAAVSGWRPCGDKAPKEHDIVLMDGPEGRHVGVMVRVNASTLMLLHSVEPIGVTLQSLGDLPRFGFTNFEFWRLHRDG